jgi:hypothetical protein
VLWREYSAAGKSFGDIQTLTPFAAAEGELKQVNYFNPHLSADGNGPLHLVFDNYERGICHTVSDDGLSWSAPRPLTPKKPLKFSSLEPQLIWSGGRAMLLYTTLGPMYLAPVDLNAGTIDTDRAVPISVVQYGMPLGGARAKVTRDGEIVIHSGGYTSWMLRARVADVLKPIASPPASATWPDTSARSRPGTQPATVR